MTLVPEIEILNLKFEPMMMSVINYLRIKVSKIYSYPECSKFESRSPGLQSPTTRCPNICLRNDVQIYTDSEFESNESVA